ncbi:MAG: hypothetical protein RIA69_01305 [Cyclobacteriaceae bacterium]
MPTNYSLTQSVSETYGQPITRPKDCDLLADDIERVTGRPISSATLRRVFGLLKSSSQLSAYNKETLTLYIEGKNDLEDSFNDWSSPEESAVNEVLTILLEKYEVPDSALAQYLLGLKIPSHMLFAITGKLIQMSIQNGHLEFITGLYAYTNILLEDRRIFRVLGKAIADHHENSADFLHLLAASKVARRQFYERYVDFGNFKSYHSWLKIYLDYETESEAQAWAQSLILFGDYLSGKEPSARGLIEFVHQHHSKFSGYHPYMAARILGTAVIFSDNDAPQLIKERLVHESGLLEIDASSPPLFSVMILQYLLIADRQDLAIHVERNLKNYQATNIWHIDVGVSMQLKIVRQFIGKDVHYTLDEVKFYNSGHANDDVVVKYYASQYAVDSFGKIQDYQHGLIFNSGFVKLKEMIR